MKKTILAAAVLVGGLPLLGYVPEPHPVKSVVEITALYYPGTEHMPEWDMVVQTRPEIKPLLGWYDEGSPEVIDWQIKWAVEHGITSFCVDWYWNRGHRRLEHWVKGYYKARYRKYLKWYIMYANHNQPGAHSSEDQIAVTKYWIDNCFKTPEYYTIDGKPVVCYFSPDRLDRDFIAEAAAKGEKLKKGDGIRRAFAISEKMLREAGLPGIHWQKIGERDATFASGITYGYVPKVANRLTRMTFDMVMESLPKLWKADPDQWLPLPTGWDDRPRSFQHARVIQGRTPEKFAQICREARAFCDKNGIRHVLIHPVNEWQEGSYVEPNEEFGFAMYDAIRDAFCEKPAAGWPKNLRPSDVGLGPYDYSPSIRSTVQRWEFDSTTEGWYRQPYGAAEVENNHEGCLAFVTTRSSNFNIRQCVMPFDASKYRTFRIRMKITPNDKIGAAKTSDLRLKWGTKDCPIIGPGITVDWNRGVASCPVVMDGAFHEYVLDLSANPDWKGKVDELWFEACRITHAHVAIDWMRFEPLQAPVLSGAGSLWNDFVAPPDAARPWCYWWWINGHADRETITADLEAMKRLGFGGVLMFDSRGYFDDDDHVVNPKAEIVWGSNEWQELVAFSIRECARLGLEFTMNASASGGTLNGFVDGKEYETDIMNREAVVAHLDRAMGPILKRVPDLVGKTFTHIYSPSYEGNVKTGGSWRTIKDTFYATMRAWAHAHGLKLYSESGGPWGWGSKSTPLDCDQLDLLAHNDFPQGEFWPTCGRCTTPNAGHANRYGRFFQRAIVLSARREGRRIASMEAFTHMYHHWSVDPAFLKPLADISFADGANRLVWHTFTCSPKKFGIPGAEYFAGSHINRHVTWHKDAAAFVKYLGRCQALLQRGEPIDDGEFASITTNYYGWGRYRKDAKAQFTTTHRREGEVDFFFVAGEGKGEVELNASCEGRTIEIWDAVTGMRKRLFTNDKCQKCSQIANGKTRVSLVLPVGGSCFVVFAPRDFQTGLKEVGEKSWSSRKEHSTLQLQLETPTQIPITNAWHVSFAYHDGIVATPPAPVTMEALREWTTYGMEDDVASTSLRYFSGTATYRTTVFIGNNTNNCKDNLALDGSQPRADPKTAQSCTQSKRSCLSCFQTTLALGHVPTGLAHVFVNGVDCGVAWCAPWEVDISNAVRSGENDIEIRYTNNWYNRLVGDCFLPENERVTRSTLRYWRHARKNATDKDSSHRRTQYSGPSADDSLQSSGILGPVTINQP